VPANRLTALKVEKAKKRGMYGDGDGLYLRVTPEGTKNWVLRYMLNGKAHWMGLGPYPLYGLQDARGKALDARRLRYEGIDPINRRRAQRAQEKLEAAKAITFRECATGYIKSHRAGWKHPKHAHQWESSLEAYVYPVIGNLPVSAVDTALVMKILEPLWSTKTETMSRVRGRIESVLDWAKARKYWTGENPALWRGHLDKLLPAKGKVRKRGHYGAPPYDQLPTLIAKLQQQATVPAKASEFAILTAVRVSDIVGSKREDRTPMLWAHVSNCIWTIPATKNEAAHKVPLSEPALALLEQMKGLDPRIVFPGVTGDSMLAAIKRVDQSATIHSTARASFRTWAAECTNYPREVCEQALAHTVGTDVERAYQRGDLFEKRRRLMAAWADYCLKPQASGTVTLLRKEVPA
jgi:integrase